VRAAQLFVRRPLLDAIVDLGGFEPRIFALDEWYIAVGAISVAELCACDSEPHTGSLYKVKVPEIHDSSGPYVEADAEWRSRPNGGIATTDAPSMNFILTDR
jgi:hypothetical protein